MAKKKLIHFRENLTFPHLFQPKYHDLTAGFPLRGHWHERFFGNDHPIVVELGCGKGEYTVGLAQRNPGFNYIGIDWKGARLWRGCKTVAEQGMKNVAFLRILVDHCEYIFAPGEVAELWITFPEPQPKKEHQRLTAPVFLARYGRIMRPGGIIHLKTDDPAVYQYTLDIIHANGHHVIWSTEDLYHSGTTEDVVTIRTFYEEMWLAMGKKICYLKFQLNTL